jgi:hypothetical protein
LGFKVSKSTVLIWPRNFFFTKFEYGYQNKAEFYADFETVEKKYEKFANKKVIKKCEKLEFVLFYATNSMTLKKFLLLFLQYEY